MNDSQRDGAFERRDFLKAAGAGVVGVVGASGAATGRATLDSMAGSGTAADPYVISSAEELRAMASDPSGSFVLDSDVDASGIGGEQGFQPIADFAGTFDGQGYEIRGLSIDRETRNVALFANTTESATIENVGVVDVDVTGAYATAGLVGENEGTVTRSYTTGTVQSGAGGLGGLVGFNGGTITESFSTATLDAAGSEDVGGLVGSNDGEIRDTYATGDVRGDRNSEDIAGLVGYNDGTVERSFAAGIVGGNQATGLVAYQSGIMTDCYWDTVSSGLDSGGGATGLTTDQMQGESASTSLSGLGFPDTWETAADAYPVLSGIDTNAQLAARPAQRAPQSVRLRQMDGDGSATDPYVVTSGQEVRAMADDPIAFFELDGDVDLSGVGGTSGFQPIENFMGELRGNGHEIRGLQIDRDARYVGLFGRLLDSGTVDHVGLVEVDVSGYYATAGLAGENRGSISRAYTAGTVQSNSDSLGGLVGFNGGSIAESFSTATLDATGSEDVGGLVGYNNGQIRDTYATGDVRGDRNCEDIAGLVGYNDGIVETSFAAGIVGGNEVGGFVGYQSGTVTDCYWDTAASGLDNGGGATGLTTDQMQGDTATFNLENFDFEGNWATVDGGYPVLAAISTQRQRTARPDRREPTSARLQGMAGDGSATDPYVVTSGQEVRAMADDPIAFFELDDDVDLGSVTSGDGFQPIENFMGELRGNGHEIRGLQIDRDTRYVGLFGRLLASATVDHVGLVEVDVSGYYATAALAGENRGSISRTFTAGTVQSNSDSLGGLVGFNGGSVTESYATVTVSATGSEDVGGLVGYNNGVIRNTYATGDVGGDENSEDIGGLVGYNDGIVETSFSAGTVTGSEVGGFIGYQSGTATDCYWDTAASGVESGGAAATGLTTEQMQGDRASFNLENFDFQTTWSIVPGEYPDLAFQGIEPPSCPTLNGTQTADIDDDTLCEDLNGNGRADFDDVNTFFASRESDAVQSNPRVFDFDGDDGVDLFDVRTLFRELF